MGGCGPVPTCGCGHESMCGCGHVSMCGCGPVPMRTIFRRGRPSGRPRGFVKIVQVNYAYAAQVSDHAALLDTYDTLTGWSEAVAGAGADVIVVQAFHYDAQLVHNGIEYVFCADARPSSGASPRRWRRPRRLEAAVLAAQPDLIHVNSLEFAPEIWLLRRALPRDVAVVVQDHANAVPRSFSLKGAVRRRLLGAADGFLFPAVGQSDPWRTNGFIAE